MTAAVSLADVTRLLPNGGAGQPVPGPAGLQLTVHAAKPVALLTAGGMFAAQLTADQLDELAGACMDAQAEILQREAAR